IFGNSRTYSQTQKGFIPCLDAVGIGKEACGCSSRSHLICKNGSPKTHKSFIGAKICCDGKCLWSTGKIDPLASVGGLQVWLPFISRIAWIHMLSVEHVLAKLR